MKLTFFEQPIFILGVARSGTTLLQSLLDGHKAILNVPAELHYYLDWKMVNYLYGLRPSLAQVNEYFLSNTDIGYFGQYVPVGAGKPYDTTSIDGRAFREYLSESKLESPSSKEYLQLLAEALVACCPMFRKGSSSYKYAMCCMNVFYIDEILSDFPNGKIIVMDRDKAEVYVSQRKFWLRALGSYYIRAYRDLPSFHFRKPYIIELMIEYILTGIMSKRRYKEHENIMFVPLSDLVSSPSETLSTISDWLDIDFTATMQVQTMCGKAYGGNLTNRKDSGGKIIDKKGKIGLKDLSRIEYFLLKRISFGDMSTENISKVISGFKFNLITIIIDLLKFLPGESNVKGKMMLLRFPITYVKNRILIVYYLLFCQRRLNSKKN